MRRNTHSTRDRETIPIADLVPSGAYRCLGEEEHTGALLTHITIKLLIRGDYMGAALKSSSLSDAVFNDLKGPANNDLGAASLPREPARLTPTVSVEKGPAVPQIILHLLNNETPLHPRYRD